MRPVSVRRPMWRTNDDSWCNHDRSLPPCLTHIICGNPPRNTECLYTAPVRDATAHVYARTSRQRGDFLITRSRTTSHIDVRRRVSWRGSSYRFHEHKAEACNYHRFEPVLKHHRPPSRFRNYFNSSGNDAPLCVRIQRPFIQHSKSPAQQAGDFRCRFC